VLNVLQNNTETIDIVVLAAILGSNEYAETDASAFEN
jgi:hypothetical protein